MSKFNRVFWMALMVALLAAGCASAGGAVRDFEKGEQLVYYDFSEPNTFEEWLHSSLLGGVVMRIQDGKYRIRLTEGDGELWWGQWGEVYGDVVIDVDVDQLSERNQNAYGLMCRVRGEVMSPIERAEIDPEVQFLATQVAASNILGTPAPEATAEVEATAEATSEVEATSEATDEADSSATPIPDEATPEATDEAAPDVLLLGEETPVPEGDGYLFLIQGAGSFGIFKSRGRGLFPLVDWTTSDAIHIGPDSNHLRAVCMGDYLAFYVNDQFVGDVVDDEYSVGQVGMVASASNILGVRVDFDNLTISEARAK